MYTKLPHEKLMDTVSTAWDRAVEYKAKQMETKADIWVLKLDWESKYSFVATEEEQKEEGITKETFMELLEFLIMENHIWNGKELRRQVIGIPMGSPVSPHLANLYRYVVEARFVEELLAKGQRQLALACEHTYAFIDDLLTFEGPLSTEEHYGIPMIVDDTLKETANFIHSK